MSENARITCEQLDLHPLDTSATGEHCRAILNDPSRRDLNAFSTLFVNLVNVSFLMSDEHVTNVTTTMASDSLMSPPKTIAGVSVETFSYIFLAIGGAAPVIFLIIVFISMKCHKYRKLKRLRKYQSRQTVTRGLWEMERKQYFKTHAKPPGYKSYMDTAHDRVDYPYVFTRSSSARTEGSTSQYSGYAATRSVTVSNSNPDVYFRETPISRLYGHDVRRLSHVRTGSLPNKTLLYVPDPAETRADKLKKSDLGTPSPHPPPSLNSEEALVLQSFDKIYQDLDMDNGSSSYTTSSSENRHRVQTKPRKIGRYQQEASRSSVVPGRSNLNTKKTITVDLHYTHPAHSGTVISEESISKSSQSSKSSESNTRPSTLPLLPQRELNDHEASRTHAPNVPTVNSPSTSSANDSPGFGGNPSKRKLAEHTRHQPNGSFTNPAYLKQDTPESPDIEITRL